MKFKNIPKHGKSFFDYSDKEKRAILLKAAKEGAKMQQEEVRQWRRSSFYKKLEAQDLYMKKLMEKKVGKGKVR